MSSVQPSPSSYGLDDNFLKKIKKEDINLKNLTQPQKKSLLLIGKEHGTRFDRFCAWFTRKSKIENFWAGRGVQYIKKHPDQFKIQTQAGGTEPRSITIAPATVKTPEQRVAERKSKLSEGQRYFESFKGEIDKHSVDLLVALDRATEGKSDQELIAVEKGFAQYCELRAFMMGGESALFDQQFSSFLQKNPIKMGENPFAERTVLFFSYERMDEESWKAFWTGKIHIETVQQFLEERSGPVEESTEPAPDQVVRAKLVGQMQGQKIKGVADPAAKILANQLFEELADQVATGLSSAGLKGIDESRLHDAYKRSFHIWFQYDYEISSDQVAELFVDKVVPSLKEGVERLDQTALMRAFNEAWLEEQSQLKGKREPDVVNAIKNSDLWESIPSSNFIDRPRRAALKGEIENIFTLQKAPTLRPKLLRSLKEPHSQYVVLADYFARRFDQIFKEKPSEQELDQLQAVFDWCWHKWKDQSYGVEGGYTAEDIAEGALAVVQKKGLSWAVSKGFFGGFGIANESAKKMFKKRFLRAHLQHFLREDPQVEREMVKEILAKISYEPSRGDAFLPATGGDISLEHYRARAAERLSELRIDEQAEKLADPAAALLIPLYLESIFPQVKPFANAMEKELWERLAGGMDVNMLKERLQVPVGLVLDQIKGLPKNGVAVLRRVNEGLKTETKDFSPSSFFRGIQTDGSQGLFIKNQLQSTLEAIGRMLIDLLVGARDQTGSRVFSTGLAIASWAPGSVKSWLMHQKEKVVSELSNQVPLFLKELIAKEIPPEQQADYEAFLAPINQMLPLVFGDLYDKLIEEVGVENLLAMIKELNDHPNSEYHQMRVAGLLLEYAVEILKLEEGIEGALNKLSDRLKPAGVVETK